MFDFERTHVPRDPSSSSSYPTEVWWTAEEPSEAESWVLVMDYADASLQQAIA